MYICTYKLVPSILSICLSHRRSMHKMVTEDEFDLENGPGGLRPASIDNGGINTTVLEAPQWTNTHASSASVLWMLVTSSARIERRWRIELREVVPSRGSLSSRERVYVTQVFRTCNHFIQLVAVPAGNGNATIQRRFAAAA